MSDREVLRDRIAEAIRTHTPKDVADDNTRPGFRIWRNGCAGCDWIGEDHDEPLADAAIDAGADFFAPPW